MGAAWHDEDPDEGHGNAPKLILAGRLAGTVDGRPVVIEANDAGILLAATLRTAWSMRRFVQALVPLLLILRQAGVPLRIDVAGVVTVSLLPSPSPLARIVVPGLVRLG